MMTTVPDRATHDDGTTREQLLAATMAELEDKGFRVLAVAAGPTTAMKLVGLIALSDPPRKDSAALVSELKGLGVRTVMVGGRAYAVEIARHRRARRLASRRNWASASAALSADFHRMDAQPSGEITE